MQIFMSYRRSDSADVSGRIYDRLAQHYGDDAIFKDVDDIPFGVNFKTYLNDMVRQCDIQLVIIGPDWIDVTDEHGRRRLDNPADFVRIEVEAALSRDIPVIPLLVGGAMMPPDSRLPDDIKELSYRNGLPIRPDPDFHRDMSRLINGMERYIEPKAPPHEAAQPAPPPSPAVEEAPPPVAKPAPTPAPSPPPARAERVVEKPHQVPAVLRFNAKQLAVMGVGIALVALGISQISILIFPLYNLVHVFAALIMGPVPGMIVAGVGAGIGAVLSGLGLAESAISLVGSGSSAYLIGRLGWKKGWSGMLIGAVVGGLADLFIWFIGTFLVQQDYVSNELFPGILFTIPITVILNLLGVLLARWLGPRIPVLRDW